LKIYTIGFTGRSASEFFTTLKKEGIRQIIDVRENNTSQLCGFTKKDDLCFFAKEILGASYIHLPFLAPDKSIRQAFKQNKNFDLYTKNFIQMIEDRNALELFNARRDIQIPFVLLCSEHDSSKCHRSIVARLLKEFFYNAAEIINL
jgi:uncharacterized protein (DUF488 family)